MDGLKSVPRFLPCTPRGVAGATQTMVKPSVYQNSLQAVPFPQQLTGYKDPQDASHRSDKSAFIRSAVML